MDTRNHMIKDPPMQTRRQPETIAKSILLKAELLNWHELTHLVNDIKEIRDRKYEKHTRDSWDALEAERLRT